MPIKAPTKRERKIIQTHRTNPSHLTQAEVKRKLNIKTSHDFYRKFYRCTIADARDFQEN